MWSQNYIKDTLLLPKSRWWKHFDSAFSISFFTFWKLQNILLWNFLNKRISIYILKTFFSRELCALKERLKGLYYLKTIFFLFKSMRLNVMKISSWFIQARHLFKVWFVLIGTPFFFIFFFSCLPIQTQCLILLVAMLVGSSNMLSHSFGIIKTYQSLS